VKSAGLRPRGVQESADGSGGGEFDTDRGRRVGAEVQDRLVDCVAALAEIGDAEEIFARCESDECHGFFGGRLGPGVQLGAPRFERSGADGCGLRAASARGGETYGQGSAWAERQDDAFVSAVDCDARTAEEGVVAKNRAVGAVAASGPGNEEVVCSGWNFFKPKRSIVFG